MSESISKSTPAEIATGIKRFSKIVQLAMEILDKHPETQRITEDGHRVANKLLDGITLPDGKAKVWIRIGISWSPFHKDQPVTSVTVEEQVSDEELMNRKKKGIIGTAIRTEFFGDGKIDVTYENSKRDLDIRENLDWERADDQEYTSMGIEPRPGFGFTVDTKDMQYLPSDADWEHIGQIENTLADLASGIPR